MARAPASSASLLRDIRRYLNQRLGAKISAPSQVKYLPESMGRGAWARTSPIGRQVEFYGAEPKRGLERIGRTRRFAGRNPQEWFENETALQTSIHELGHLAGPPPRHMKLQPGEGAGNDFWEEGLAEQFAGQSIAPVARGLLGFKHLGGHAATYVPNTRAVQQLASAYAAAMDPARRIQVPPDVARRLRPGQLETLQAGSPGGRQMVTGLLNMSARQRTIARANYARTARNERSAGLNPPNTLKPNARPAPRSKPGRSYAPSPPTIRVAAAAAASHYRRGSRRAELARSNVARQSRY